MLKKFVLVVFFLSFFVLVSAEIQMIKPIETVFGESQLINVGQAVRGESVDFIFVSKNGSLVFDSIDLLVVPKNWVVSDAEFFGETVGLTVVIPKNEKTGLRHLRFKLFDASFPSQSKFFDVDLLIKDSLVSSQISPLKRDAIVGDFVVFDISLLNDSVSDHLVLVSSDLPSYWFKPRLVKVGAKSLEQLKLEVVPKVHGLKSFNFRLSSALNDSTISVFPVELIVVSSFESRYSSAFFGVPFFSLSLLPFYLVNAFVSSFLG
jgi:hypothetical protein